MLYSLFMLSLVLVISCAPKTVQPAALPPAPAEPTPPPEPAPVADTTGEESVDNVGSGRMRSAFGPDAWLG